MCPAWLRPLAFSAPGVVLVGRFNRGQRGRTAMFSWWSNFSAVVSWMMRECLTCIHKDRSPPCPPLPSRCIHGNLPPTSGLARPGFPHVSSLSCPRVTQVEPNGGLLPKANPGGGVRQRPSRHPAALAGGYSPHRRERPVRVPKTAGSREMWSLPSLPPSLFLPSHQRRLCLDRWL